MSVQGLPAHDPGVRRRRFLALAGVVGAALVYPLVPLWPRLDVRSARLSERLVDLVAGQESARAVGAAYLTVVPAEASRSLLVRRLAGALGMTPAAAADDQSFRAMLAHRISQDFADGETCDVDGWVLSRTECRLSALSVVGGQS